MQSTTTTTPPFSLRLPKELRNTLEALAERDSRKLSNYITRILTNHVIDSTGRPDRQDKP